MRKILLAAVVLAALTASGVSGAAAPWRPASTDRFQIDLSATPTPRQLRGAYSMIETDEVDTSATVVASVHRLGKRAVCYVDVGTWEKWRPDAKRFPSSVLGKPDAGWPGERWLDVRRTSILLPLMRARFAVCKAKGFDAVDPDNVNAVENHSGFPITLAEQLRYDRAIAALAHADGMAVALKSYAAQAAALQPSFDFVVDEECAKYHECTTFTSFVAAAKPVFDIEYTTSLSFCSALPRGVFGIAKHLSLDAWVRRCPG